MRDRADLKRELKQERMKVAKLETALAKLPCPECDGHGKVPTHYHFGRDFYEWKKCERCDGKATALDSWKLEQRTSEVR